MIASLVFLVLTSLPAAWANWSEVRHVDAPSIQAARLARFVLPIEVYGNSQVGLADLRIISDTGTQIPYAIDTAVAARHEVRGPVTVSDIGFVPGKYTQAVADVGTAGDLHNELTVVPGSGESDFFEWVAVDASDDRQTWRIMRDRVPIFRFESENLTGRQQIAFPQTRARWLRVRILDSQRPFAIDSIEVARFSETLIERAPLAASFTQDLQSQQRKSVWVADTGYAHVPVSALEFSAAQPAFHRPVTISASDDGKTWTEVAQGDIYESGADRQMIVEVLSGNGRYWQVTVFNRDDVPIQGLHMQLLTTPTYVSFEQEPDRSYLLIYGNPHAQAPEYDFTTLTTKDQRIAATLVSTGPQSSNTAYASPEPWTERHAWIMWVALIAAVAVIAAIAIFSMRASGGQTEPQ